jgi:hypothetical protein
MEFNCLVGLRDFKGALESIQERIDLWKADRQKYLVTAKHLNDLLRRDGTLAEAIVKVLEPALRDKLLDVATLQSDAQLDTLRSNSTVAGLFAKYAGK